MSFLSQTMRKMLSAVAHIHAAHPRHTGIDVQVATNRRRAELHERTELLTKISRYRLRHRANITTNEPAHANMVNKPPIRENKLPHLVPVRDLILITMLAAAPGIPCMISLASPIVSLTRILARVAVTLSKFCAACRFASASTSAFTSAFASPPPSVPTTLHSYPNLLSSLPKRRPLVKSRGE